MPIQPQVQNSTHALPAIQILTAVHSLSEPDTARNSRDAGAPHLDNLERDTEALNAALHARSEWLNTEQNRGLELAMSSALALNMVDFALADAHDHLAACELNLADLRAAEGAGNREMMWLLQEECFEARKVVASLTVAFERASERLEVDTHFLNQMPAQADALFDARINDRFQQALRTAAEGNSHAAEARQEPWDADAFSREPWGAGAQEPEFALVLAQEPEESQVVEPDPVVCEPVGMPQGTLLNSNHHAF